MAEERAAEEPVPSSITVAATTTDRVLPALAAGAVFATIVLELTIDLAVARLRRKESLKTWAQRIGVSVTTLQRLEAGDPGVGIGVVVTALWLIQRDGALAQLAAPELDQGAIELDIRQAQALGRARAQAAAQSRSTVRRQSAKQGRTMRLSGLCQPIAKLSPNEKNIKLDFGVEHWLRFCSVCFSIGCFCPLHPHMGSPPLFAVASRSTIFASTYHPVALAIWCRGAKFVWLLFQSWRSRFSS